MITTVSLNPSIDRTITINGFNYGSLNRAVSARSDIGGKAVNVALCASAYKLETECVGFMFRENGKIFERQLARSGVGFDFVWLDGFVRTNIKLLDESTKTVTEINEVGPKIDSAAINDLKELITQHAESSDYIVFTGSFPPGCPSDLYKTLLEAVDGLDCRVVLDADGEAFKNGVTERPFLIKPNRKEIETALGRSVNTIEEVKAAAAHFIDIGVENVIVSLGKDGAYFTNGSESYFGEPLDVPVCSTVGAGDAMIAGMLLGYMNGMSSKEAFEYSVASATACVMTEGTQFDIRKEMLNLLNVVNIHAI